MTLGLSYSLLDLINEQPALATPPPAGAIELFVVLMLA